MAYIYKITNNLNGKSYIGQTTQTVQRRFTQHCSSAYRNRQLTQAIIEYGKDNFTLETLEVVNNDKLDEREQYWISYYDTVNTGYNQSIGGKGSLGYHLSDEARCKIAELNHYKKNNLGKHWTEETKRKLSKAAKGKPGNKSVLGKHRVYDNPEHTKYHYE